MIVSNREIEYAFPPEGGETYLEELIRQATLGEILQRKCEYIDLNPNATEDEVNAHIDSSIKNRDLIAKRKSIQNFLLSHGGGFMQGVRASLAAQLFWNICLGLLIMVLLFGSEIGQNIWDLKFSSK